LPQDPAPLELPPLRQSLLRTVLRLAALAVAVYGIHLAMNWAIDHVEAFAPSIGNQMRIGIMVAILLAYAVLLAIPFVPGIEVGLMLLLIRGAEIAPYVYLATVLGLVLAYAAGHLLSYRWLRQIFLDLRLPRACRMLDALEPLTAEHRLALLRKQLPWVLGALAVNYRYLLLALLINLPGSGLLGGGGGICMIAGLTRLFHPRATILTIVLAVLPFPLFFWLWGPGIFA
jgi:hypothetical protein